MDKSDRKFCPALWFSGFFGLGAVVHLVRLILRFPVTLGTWEVPLGFSLLAVVETQRCQVDPAPFAEV